MPRQRRRRRKQDDSDGWEAGWKARVALASRIPDPWERNERLYEVGREAWERYRNELFLPWLDRLPDDDLRYKVARELASYISQCLEEIAESPRGVQAELRRICLLTATMMPDDRALEALRLSA